MTKKNRTVLTFNMLEPAHCFSFSCDMTEICNFLLIDFCFSANQLITAALSSRESPAGGVAWCNNQLLILADKYFRANALTEHHVYMRAERKHTKLSQPDAVLPGCSR